MSVVGFAKMLGHDGGNGHQDTGGKEKDRQPDAAANCHRCQIRRAGVSVSRVSIKDFGSSTRGYWGGLQKRNNHGAAVRARHKIVKTKQLVIG